MCIFDSPYENYSSYCVCKLSIGIIHLESWLICILNQYPSLFIFSTETPLHLLSLLSEWFDRYFCLKFDFVFPVFPRIWDEYWWNTWLCPYLVELLGHLFTCLWSSSSGFVHQWRRRSTHSIETRTTTLTKDDTATTNRDNNNNNFHRDNDNNVNRVRATHIVHVSCMVTPLIAHRPLSQLLVQNRENFVATANVSSLLNDNWQQQQSSNQQAGTENYAMKESCNGGQVKKRVFF